MLFRSVTTEMSFAFQIKTGSWSPDYTEYTIQRYDINRGDVSAVNYGANPHTSIAARSAEFLQLLEGVDGAALRAAHDRLGERVRSTGRSRYARALADVAGLRDRMRQRAASSADMTMLTVLLTQLAAADAGFDPIVEALTAVDDVLDMAQASLAQILGLPDPDSQDDPVMQSNAAGMSPSLARQLISSGRL